MATTFHIRPATLAAGDDKRLLANFDSQLSWLASVGSDGQWGSEPRSNNEKFKKKCRSQVQRSEAAMAQGGGFHPEWAGAYILEAEVEAESLSDDVESLAGETQKDGRVRVPVAAMVLEAKAPEYVRPVLPEQDVQDPFIFLSYLLSDRRTSSINKGAGGVLIKHSKDKVQKLGIRRICGDCWAGNDRKLVK